MRFGFQVKISEGYEKALAYALKIGCECIQTLITSPLTWHLRTNIPALREYIASLRSHDIQPIAIHAPYLLNLASPEGTIYEKSLQALMDEFHIAQEVEADFLIVHAGSHRGQNGKEGVKRLISALKAVERSFASSPEKSPILLVENTAGGGGEIGASLEELEEILNHISWQGIGICLDTCHLCAYGYDLSSPRGVEGLAKEAKKRLGDRLHLIHLNDCKAPCGSKYDRHENLGEGSIGLAGFRAIINHPFFSPLPAIMETPASYQDDLRNIALAKRLRATPPGSSSK